MKRLCTFAVLTAALLAGGVALTARRDNATTPVAANAATRQAIKSMPILERPNRVGHFYGNTVRRAHDRRGG